MDRESTPRAGAATPHGLGFEEVYRRFGAAIRARCRRLLREPAAAEDATQEVFLRARGRLADLRGARETFAFLWRTATNHCLNEIRARRQRPTLLASLPERAGAAPESLLSNQDLVARLVRALPVDLVEAAWLYHIDGFEQAEIARICGVSTRTVIARLGRFAARARIFVGRSEGRIWARKGPAPGCGRDGSSGG